MPSPAPVECPACMATLKVPEDKLGKKIRCPKCSEVFVAEASEEVEDFEPDDEPRPSRGKGPARKAAKKSGSGVLIGAIVGGIAFVVVAFVVFRLVTSGGGNGAAPQVTQTPVPAAAPAAAPAADPAAAMAAAMRGAHGSMPTGSAHGAPAGPAAHGSAVAAVPVQPAAAPAPAAVASSTATSPSATARPAFVSQSASGAAKLDLSWIPADTELAINLRPAAIWNAPALQQALKHPFVLLGVGQMQAMTGITPTDIDGVTVALKLPETKVPGAAQEALPEGVALSPGAEVPEVANLQPVIVVHLKKPLLESVWERPDFPLQVADYAGQTVRKFSPPAANGKQLTFAIHQPNELTIVAGLQGTVEKLIDGKGAAGLYADWAPLDPNLQLQIAARPRNLPPSWQAMQQAAPAGTPEEKRLQEALEKHMSAFAGGLQLTDGVELVWNLQADSEAGGKELAAALQPQLDKAHATFMSQFEAGFAQSGGPAPPEIKQLVNVLQQNSKFAQQGAVSSLTSRIPADQMGLFAALAARAQQNPMAGMMLGGPPGGPPGFPGGMPTGERSGQTPPMATRNADALPGGLALEASTMWDAPQPGSVPTVLMQFRVTAPDDVILCAAGQFEFRPPTTDAGSQLAATSPHNTTLSGPELILRTYVTPLEEPADGAANVAVFHLPFKGADPKAKSLARCEGQFQLVAAKSQQEFRLPIKKPIPAKPEWPEAITAANLSVRIERSRSEAGPAGEELIVSCGASAVVSRLQLLDADGAPLGGWEAPVIRYASERGSVVQKLSSESGEKLPSSFVLKLVLFEGTETLTVPFELSGLSLPDPAARPQLSPPQFPAGGFPGAPFPGGAVPPGAFPGSSAPPGEAAGPAEPPPGGSSAPGAQPPP